MFQIVIQIKTIEQWVKVNYLNLQYEDALQKVPNTNTKKQKGIQLPAKLVNIHES